MKRIAFLLLACFALLALHAQEVSISEHDYDSLRYEIKKLRNQIQTENAACLSKDSVIHRLQKETVDLRKKNTGLESDIEKLKSSLAQMRNTSDSLSEESSKLRSIQKEADNNAGKLANGRLYFRYDNEIVQSSIKLIEEIKTASIKQKFSQVLPLLQGYQNYSQELKTALTTVQNDALRKVRNKADEYKARCISEIKHTSYYTEVFARKSAGNWSIPYLDNIINVATRCLQHHDPGHGNYVDFTVLIEIL